MAVDKKKEAKRKTKSKKLDAMYQGFDIEFDVSNDLEAAAISGKGPFEIQAYSGGALSLPNFDHPAYIDLSDVTAMSTTQLPIIRDHNPRRPLGHGRPVVSKSGLKLVDSVLSHDNNDTREVRAAASKGFSWQSSVGGRMRKRPRKIQAGQTRTVNGRSVAGPAYVIAGFLWKEQTVCVLGCDEERATARIAASEGAIDMNFEEWLEASNFVADELNDEQVTALRAMYDKQQEAEELRREKTELEAAAAAAKQIAQEKEDAIKAAAEAEQRQKDALTESTDVAAAAAAKLAEGGATGADTSSALISEVKASLDVERYRADYLKKIRETKAAEDRRVAAVDELKAEFVGKVPSAVLAELTEKAYMNELNHDQYELALWKARRDNPVEAGTTDRKKLNMNHNAMAIEASLLSTCGVSEERIAAGLRRQGTEDEIEAAMNMASEKDLRGMSLHGLIFACIESHGEYAPSSQVNNEVIRAALQLSNDSATVHASSGFSTVSLPGILSNVANKAMLAAYEDNSGVMREIASSTDTSDFKQFSRHRMTESGVFEKVGPTGEIKHATLSEETYTNQVETYGRMFALSRQMMINDDLDAFMQIPRILGRQSAHAVEQTGIQTLTGAATAAGAGAATDFFRGAALGNSQPNYITGASSALSSTSLGSAYELFLNQTDSDGKPVMIAPAVLLTTTRNAVLSMQLYNNAQVRPGGSNTDNKTPIDNEWRGMFEPKNSAYLGTAGMNSGTAAPNQWFLACRATDDYAPLQIAYLRGQRTPTIEQSDVDFNQLGVQFRGYFDFGVALQDPRCIVKSDGE